MLENCAHLQFAVTHGVLKLVKNVDAESKTVDSLGADFVFKSSDWDNLTKNVIFLREGIEPVVRTMSSGQSCVTVPWEILDVEDDSFYEIGVIGIGSNSERLPTNRVRLRINKSCCAILDSIT